MKTDDIVRFKGKYQEQPNGCWEWTGAKNKDGYGRLQVAGKMFYSHRFSFEMYCGPIPDGMLVCHTCDNPGCVNPTHLFIGTPKDNTTDMVNKGRLIKLNGKMNGKAKLSENDVATIKNMLSSGHRQCDVAKIFFVNQSTVSDIARGKAWGHI